MTIFMALMQQEVFKRCNALNRRTRFFQEFSTVEAYKRFFTSNLKAVLFLTQAPTKTNHFGTLLTFTLLFCFFFCLSFLLLPELCIQLALFCLFLFFCGFFSFISLKWSKYFSLFRFKIFFLVCIFFFFDYIS